MITFQEAYDIVVSHARDFGVEKVPLLDSLGRILAEDIDADRDFPPYDRVTMDGIAVQFDGAQGMSSLKITGVGAAGAPQITLTDSSACVEIMTGAILPEGADTVIRYEDVSIQDGYAQINAPFKKAQNVHFKGLDKKIGDVLISTGKRIGSEDIGILATVGMSEIMTFRLPKTLIISTGDELVEVSEYPLPHQIRMSNVYQIGSTLLELGIEPDYNHLADDKGTIEIYLRRALSQYDLIILSGGVSKGKFDFIPSILEKLEVEKHFHKVKQRPGKPFWFGSHNGGCTIFALPGNPVSSYMCTQVYLKSWLLRCLGIDNFALPTAVLAEEVHFRPDLTYFLEVKATTDDHGRLIANPMKGNGSGDLANLSRANAFIRLPQGKEVFKKGEVHPIILFSRL